MLAFPSAWGHGKNTIGGRGGQVIEVTNLNDSGAGSFREAVQNTAGPRIVVFRVGGWIELQSEVIIGNDFLTIAGQTAPGGGIGLRVATGGTAENRAYVQINASQVIMRGIRSRPGIWYPGQSVQVYYCVNIGTGARDVIIDRCSFSWADDTSVQTWRDVQRATIQRCIISESPAEAINFGSGPPEYGTSLSLLRNLLVHNRRRNPQIFAHASEVKNNLVYNHRGDIDIENTATVDIEGNHYIAGPNTTGTFTFELINPVAGMQIFVLNNITPERPDNTGDEWLIINGDEQYRSLTRVGSSDYQVIDVNQVRATVLADVGALPLDAVDQRIIGDATNETGTWIDDESEVGGWPALAAGTPPVDTDSDGMPDAWEIARGLDPNISNPNADTNGDGYNDVENYINEPFDGVTFQIPSAPAGIGALTPTFHNIGIDWSPSGATGQTATVEYRVAGASVWNDAQDLWYDSRSSCYRGSIVELLPGTLYEVRLTIAGITTETFQSETWSEELPVAETVYIGDTSSPLVIDRAGTESGYILYTGRPGAGRPTIDVANLANYAVDISGDSSYIILRDLLITGAALENIFLRGSCHDVVIEDCELTNWGVPEANGGVGNNDDGAIGNEDAGSPYRIIIQRNRIHDPRGFATSWADGEPGGPQAIRLKDTAGNNVIRYNEIYSTSGRYFETGMRGGTAQSNLGFPGKNSDIYQNFISHVWNNGIAAEGGGQNVRIYRNYLEDVYIMFRLAPIAIGPLYLFRNIVGRSRRLHTTEDSDAYQRGSLLALGDVGGLGSSRLYVYHNTSLQPEPEPGKTQKLGVGGGIMGTVGDVFEVLARNNVLSRHDGAGAIFTDNTNSCTNSLDYDYFNGALGDNCSGTPHEANGIGIGAGVWPVFASENFWNGRLGTFALDDDGLGDAESLDNFNDSSAAPDIGAYQSGEVPMKFGLEAARAAFTAPLRRTIRSSKRPVII